MSAIPRRVVIPTDYGPIETALDWLPTDPISDAIQPGRARLTAERIYDGLDWAAIADVTLDEHLQPVHVVATLHNPLHRDGPSDSARQSWSSEAIRFTNTHLTPNLILSLVRAGADDWLALTGRRVAAFSRRLAKEQEAHRRAVLAQTAAHEDDPAVRLVAASLVDAWQGTADELLAEARGSDESFSTEAATDVPKPLRDVWANNVNPPRD